MPEPTQRGLIPGRRAKGFFFFFAAFQQPQEQSGGTGGNGNGPSCCAHAHAPPPLLSHVTHPSNERAGRGRSGWNRLGRVRLYIKLYKHPIQISGVESDTSKSCERTHGPPFAPFPACFAPESRLILSPPRTAALLQPRPCLPACLLASLPPFLRSRLSRAIDMPKRKVRGLR